MGLKEKVQLTKVKKVRVTVRDLEENAMRIKRAMDEMAVGTPEWERLQEEFKKEQENIKKFKEAHTFGLTLKDGLVIGGTTIGMLFLIALNREWPTAIKTAGIILKWIPFKG